MKQLAPYLQFFKRLQSYKEAFLILGILALGMGIYLSLFGSPEDYQHGDMVRMLYVHVPFSWGGLAAYSFMGISSILFIIFKNPSFFLLCRAMAPIGFMLTTLSLITGSIWGHIAWGTYWVWDARLTSTLILWMMYVAFLLSSSRIPFQYKPQSSLSILVILSWVNIPIIKFSVNWWATLHQSQTISLIQRPSMDLSMLLPLAWMTFAFFFLCIYFFFLRLSFLELQYKLINRTSENR